MCFALISFLLATPQRAQARTREAYVSQSANGTTLTFYYDDQRATRTGTTWGINARGIGRDRTTTRVVFDASFRDFRPTTTDYWFYFYSALKQIEGLEYLNTSEVKDMYRMFEGCSSLTSLDLSHFNTQNVTNMSGMFEGCSSLTSLDLSHFNTQNVTGMWGMFEGCSSLTSLDLSHFNTQNVTGMSGMFDGCSSLTSLDLSHFNTQNVASMWRMFKGCSSLTSLDLSHFNTQNVKDMREMFFGCSGLTSLDISNFNTQNVTDMSSMFYGCSGLTSLDLSHFKTQKVTDMWAMFSGCSGLPSLDLSHFNTRNVTDMGGMFYGCSGLISLDLSHFNTQNVKEMGGMFYGCSGLISLNLSHFNTQNVKDMRGMFEGCLALTTINNYTEWLCTTSKDMFAGCTKLKGAVAYDENKTDFNMANPETGYFTRSNDGGVEAYVAQSADKTTFTFYYDVQRPTRTGKTWGIEETEKDGDATFPAWVGTSQITTRVVFDASFRDFRPTTTARWFYVCRKLKQIEGLEYLNTSEVEDMSLMFYGCLGLISLDLSHFNTQNVTDMDWMFDSCWALTTIYCNTAWQCPESREMFDGCGKLKGAVPYNEYKTDARMANPETGYFTAKPTAVESVRFGTDSAQHIYTLQGKRVRGAWKHLPAGVYVVNGKKTVKP